MSRSLKKPPYVYAKLIAKIEAGKPEPIKTWARDSEIAPEFVGHAFDVHNGKGFVTVRVSEEMVGHRLGEFSPTKKFIRHGGKANKEAAKKK
jgi:small subunit ribosomal protein S19